MITDKQIQANIENAKKSTGPNDTNKTRFNGIKHGILSDNIIVENLENKSQFDSFLDNLMNDLSPDNTLQEVIIEKIACDFWRMRRLLTYEKSRITDRLGSFANIHRMYNDPEFEIIIRETHEKTCGEIEIAKEENNIEKLAQLETRKGLLESDLMKIESVKGVDWENQCNSRLFPSIESLELIVRYETALERGLSRKLEILQRLKIASLRKK